MTHPRPEKPQAPVPCITLCILPAGYLSSPVRPGSRLQQLLRTGSWDIGDKILSHTSQSVHKRGLVKGASCPKCPQNTATDPGSMGLSVMDISIGLCGTRVGGWM